MTTPDQTIPRYTARQVAAMTGLAYDTVRRRGITDNIGTLVNPRLRMYSDADVAWLRSNVAGKPRGGTK